MFVCAWFCPNDRTHTRPLRSLRRLRWLPIALELVLENEQIVGGRHGNDVVQRMPGGVQDFLVKVQTVDADLVLFALAAGADFARLQHHFRLDDVARRLQRQILGATAAAAAAAAVAAAAGDAAAVALKHAEKVVVAAGHD